MTIFHPSGDEKSKMLDRMDRRAEFLDWLAPGLIILLTVTAFLPVLQNGFVWDDKWNFQDNLNYRGLGWAQLRWMFSTFHLGHYQPLSWMSLALDYLLWGVDPVGYHLTNLFLHAINAVLFYFLAVRLLALSTPPVAAEFPLRVAAGFAAAIFSIHPLRVESVAWTTERRDVLSGLFFLLALLCYLRATTGERRDYTRWLSVTAIVYVLSLLSKAIGMTLPLVLLLLDVYPLKRLGGGVGRWFGPEVRRVWWEKIPFLVPALVFGIIALLAQGETGALKPLEQYGVASRLAQALYGFVFYLWKTLLPLKLYPLYWVPVHFNPLDWPYLLSGALVLAFSVGLWMLRKRWPALLAIWVYYVVLLAPVSGVAQSGEQFVADRYSYLSCLGWAILAGAGALYGWSSRWWRLSVSVLAGVVALLGVLTWNQVQVWHDSVKLWQQVAADSPDSWGAVRNLARALRGEGKREEANQLLLRSLKNHAGLAEAYIELGNAFAEDGKVEGGINYYRRALEIDPFSAVTHQNLANALAVQNKFDEAIEHYHRALEINPRYRQAHFNWAKVLRSQGRVGEAIEHYHRAIEIDPDYKEAHLNLGNALAAQLKFNEAIEHYRRAIEIDPSYMLAHFNWGKALALRGRWDEAIEHYRRVLEIDPKNAAAQFTMGEVLVKKGDPGQGIEHFRRALQIQPQFKEAQKSLDEALARQNKKSG